MIVKYSLGHEEGWGYLPLHGVVEVRPIVLEGEIVHSDNTDVLMWNLGDDWDGSPVKSWLVHRNNPTSVGQQTGAQHIRATSHEHGISHHIVCSHAVFLCNDAGDTIERI